MRIHFKYIVQYIYALYVHIRELGRWCAEQENENFNIFAIAEDLFRLCYYIIISFRVIQLNNRNRMHSRRFLKNYSMRCIFEENMFLLIVKWANKNVKCMWRRGIFQSISSRFSCSFTWMHSKLIKKLYHLPQNRIGHMILINLCIGSSFNYYYPLLWIIDISMKLLKEKISK